MKEERKEGWKEVIRKGRKTKMNTERAKRLKERMNKLTCVAFHRKTYIKKAQQSLHFMYKNKDMFEKIHVN
jgi:hypothetical protein